MRQRIIWAGLGILLLGAILRIWQMDTFPPGLQHDEVFNAREAIAGEFQLFYASNQGREGAYIWLLGLADGLFGRHWLMIGLPSLFVGMLTLALSYRVFGRIYGWPVGTLTAALLAVGFFPILLSRWGLRAMLLLPLTLLLIWLMRDWRRGWWPAVGVGVILGASVYVYTSALALVAAFGLTIGVWLVLDADRRLTLMRATLALALAGIIALPMVLTRLDDPAGTARVSNVAAPLTEFRAGQPDLLVDNVWQVLGMAAFTGDPLWRYNVAERPLFVLPVGVLVYLGAVFLLGSRSRWRVNVFVLAVVVAGLVPSVVTIDAPAYLRVVTALPGIFFLVAYGAWRLTRWLPRAYQGWAFALAAGLIFGVTALVDAVALRVTWPQNDTVNAIYRDDLAQLAQAAADSDEPVIFVSTSNAELDPLIYSYYRHPDDTTEAVFFDGLFTILLNDSGSPRLFVPPTAPIGYENARWLDRMQVDQTLNRQDGALAYTVYRQTPATVDALRAVLLDTAEPAYQVGDVDYAYPAQFDRYLQVEGVVMPTETVARSRGGVNLDLYLRPLVNRPAINAQIFAHLLDADGTVRAQRDLMGTAPAEWDTRSIMVQLNYIPFPPELPPGDYRIAIGLYDWTTGERYPLVEDGETLGDYFYAGTVRVVAE